MRAVWLLMAIAVLLAGSYLLGTAPASGSSAADDSIEHGKYLVHDVAKCIECHSPRDSRGDLDQNRLLRGAPIPLKSPYENDPWAFNAPAIAGLPGWSTAEVVHLLRTGTRFSGRRPLPPMPQFRMNETDARAVAGYLESLR